MEFHNEFRVSFKTEAERETYKRLSEPLLRQLSDVEMAIMNTRDFKEKERLMEKRFKIKAAINHLPIEIRQKALDVRRKEEEKKRKEEEKIREREERAREKQEEAECKAEEKIREREERAREKQKEAERKARKKEENKIEDAITKILETNKEVNRSAIKEQILSKNQFKWVDYDEVESEFLKNQYEHQVHEAAKGSATDNSEYLNKVASLMEISPKQVEEDIVKEKKQLEIEALKAKQKEELEKTETKVNLIAWGIILVLSALEYAFLLGWWKWLSIPVTLIVALTIKSKILQLVLDKVKAKQQPIQ